MGGGPAGIAAAVHAAEAGARTLLLDEQARPGGQIWRGEAPPAAREWLDRLARSGATVLAGATVVDAPGPNELLVERDGLPIRVAYERLVLATGARELFLPFPGWTLPGVVGVGGAQALLKAGARFEGLRVVVAGSGPLLLAVAAALKQAGARIVGIAEQAPLSRLAAFGAGLWRQPHRIAEGLGYAATLRGVPYRTGTWVREALGDAGVLRVVLGGARAGEPWECDVLACGFGLVPNLELPRLLGCETTAERRRRRRVAAHEPGRRLRGGRAVPDRRRRARSRHRRDRRPRRRRARDAADARQPARAGDRLRRAARPRVRPAGRAPVARSPRHDRLPLRGRAARPPRRGSTPHARRSCTRAPAWAPARAACAARRSAFSAASRPTACARRSRRFPSRCWPGEEGEALSLPP